MSRSMKRKRDDLQDDYSAGIEDEMNKSMKGSKKHTVDSDSDDGIDSEDYNKKKHDVLQDDDIEGQEEQSEDIEDDGEVKITPFNMKDEMEEGYFDGQGMYIWNKKDGTEVRDSWLDSIDSMTTSIKKITSKITSKGTVPRMMTVKVDSSDSEVEEQADTVKLYQECLGFMRPGENILQAIKRLGGGKQLSASERLKQKKLAKLQGESSVSIDTEKEAEKAKSGSDVTNLTGLANKILTSTGDMDVYQETYESIVFKIRQKSSLTPPKPAEGDGLDMFSE